MESAMDDEIVELQSRLAFQEQTILELSDVLARQQTEIDRLKSDLERVQQQFRELLDFQSQLPGEEPPPPHY